MALDGNGTYSPPAPQFPAIPNTVIYADDFNQIILDIATALSTAIFRDGQAAFTANQSMGGNKLTNLANGVNLQDAVTVLQVFTDPTFTGTTVDGVKIVGSKLTVTTATVALPAGTAIGTVTAAELARLAGVTSNIQDQINAKANLDGGNTFTGTQNLTAALADGSTAVTQPSGDTSTKVASTAFVMTAAFNTALPSQSGNSGKFVSTDGTDAFWADIPQYPLTALSVI